MNPPLRHPDVAAVLAIHDAVLAAHGGAAGIRDKNLLESALAAPQATIMGEPVFHHSVEVAAAYLFYLFQNHPFTDGNKRTALATCLVFLDTNELLPDDLLEVDAWESLVMNVASGQMNRAETAEQLRNLLEPSSL